MQYILWFFLNIGIIVAIVLVIKITDKTINKYRKQISLFFVLVIPLLMSIYLVFMCEIFMAAPIVTEFKTFFKDFVLYSSIILMVLMTIYTGRLWGRLWTEKKDIPGTDEINYFLSRTNLSFFAAYFALLLIPIFLFINIKYHLFDMLITDLIMNYSFNEIIENTETQYKIGFVIFGLIPAYFFVIFFLPAFWLNETVDYTYDYLHKLDFCNWLMYSKYKIYFRYKIIFRIPFVNILLLFIINRKTRKFINCKQAEK